MDYTPDSGAIVKTAWVCILVSALGVEEIYGKEGVIYANTY